MHFFPSVAGKALAGHVFETIQVKSSEQCEIRCYRDHQCFSVNLGPYQVNGHACELSKSDHVRNPDDLVLRPGYIYKGTEVRRYIGCNPWLCYFLAKLSFMARNFKSPVPLVEEGLPRTMIVSDQNFVKACAGINLEQ